MTILTYDVEYDPLGTPIDITDNVERFEWTEVGTGEIRSGTLRLNAQFGQFITSDVSGNTPIIGQFDQIKLTVVDRNSVAFTTIYEVDTLRPINDTQQGTVLEIELLGREYHLDKVMFAKPFFRENAFVVARDIMDFYNDPDSKGTLQPDISGGDVATNNTLPQWTSNEFRFDLNEQSALDGLNQVVDKMGSSVAAGGGGDFWELKWLDSAGLNVIFPQIYISGNPPAQQTNGVFDFTKAITITDTLSVNPAEEEGGIENSRGTVVGSWGANGYGSLPVEYMNFHGANEAWIIIPEFVNTLVYPTDSLVITAERNLDGDNRHFRALQTVQAGGGNPPAGGDANWNELTFQDYLSELGILPLYSPWTNTADTAWRVSGGNPAGVVGGTTPNANTASCWDSNLVIVDTDGTRTNADIRAISTQSVSIEYKYQNPPASGQYFLYRGFRIMVDVINLGATAAPFNQNGGNDRFGNPYANNVAKHNGGQATGATEYLNWDVFRQLQDLNMVTIDHEGKTYQSFQFSNVAALDPWVSGGVPYYFPDDRVSDAGVGYQCNQIHTPNLLSQPPNSTFWNTLQDGVNELRDMSGGNELFNDCYHPINNIDLDPDGGFFQKPKDGGTSTFGSNSAIRYTYTFASTDYVDFLPDTGDKPRYYRIGAWANFKFPFAPNELQGDDIGFFYGNNAAKREPVTVDTSNLHFNHNGEIGFNNLNAVDLGALDALVTTQKFRYKGNWDDDDTALILIGNIQCRCTCYDTSDNTVVQDFTIPFNDRWATIVLPLEGFSIYRARTPAKWGSITKAFVKQVEILNVFEWKNLKKIGFQFMQPYDSQGRYDPQAFDVLNQVLRLDGVAIPTQGRIDWSFDGFYFSKNDLALSAPDTERAIMPQFFDEPFISNHVSLVQSNQAKLEVTGFQHQQYDVGTEGSFDINFADSFYLENKFLVNNSDKPDGVGGFVPNTIKLVAKKIVYTIDKQPQGAGGFLRTITGIKRLE